MAGRKKTTFAKMARESKLRERRMLKQAKKEARKLAGEDPYAQPGETPTGDAYDAQFAQPSHAPTGD